MYNGVDTLTRYTHSSEGLLVSEHSSDAYPPGGSWHYVLPFLFPVYFAHNIWGHSRLRINSMSIDDAILVI